MVICCVAFCRNSTASKNNNLVFHRFPKDKTMAKIWFLLCRKKNRKSLYPNPSDRICSEHFRESDYERDLMNELFDRKVRKARFLKSNAVPSVNLFIGGLYPRPTPTTPIASKSTSNSESAQRLSTQGSCLHPMPRGSAGYSPSIAISVKRKRGRPRRRAFIPQASLENELTQRSVAELPRKTSSTEYQNSPRGTQLLDENLNGSNGKTFALPSYHGEFSDTPSTKYKKILPKKDAEPRSTKYRQILAKIDKTVSVPLPNRPLPNRPLPNRPLPNRSLPNRPTERNITHISGNNDTFVLNLSGLNINQFERTPMESPASLATSLLLDNNLLHTLPNLDTYTKLIRISLVNNQLDSLIWFDNLPSLRILDLSVNKITSLDGLWELSNLTAVSLSRNCISILKGQKYSTESSLEFLDLSSNKISEINDLSMLTNLKELLLQQNEIKTLQNCKSYLPPSLSKLALAENAIKSLGSVSELSCLPNLTDLSLKQNPCLNVLQLVDVQNKPLGPPRSFDFRPFVLTQCRNVKKIDDRDVQDLERLMSDWLLSEGQIYQICNTSNDCHAALVTYLAEVCPVTPQGMKSATVSAVPSDEATSPCMSMELPLNIKPEIETVQNSSTSNTPEVTTGLIVKNEDCSSSPCAHYIELIEEKAKNYKLKRQNEELETQNQEMAEKFQLIETSLLRNGMHINDLLVKVEVEEDCID